MQDILRENRFGSKTIYGPQFEQYPPCILRTDSDQTYLWLVSIFCLSVSLHEYDDESNDAQGIISGVPLLRGPLRVDPNDIVMAS